MSNAWAIGEINYMQRFYKLDECMFLSVDSKGIDLKAVTNTNCELVGTLINILKDSTQIGQSSKSSKYNSVSKEVSRSTLVNKVVSSEKCKLKDITGNFCVAPAFQDFSKIGSPPLTNASISTSASTICVEKIVSPVANEERPYTLAVVDERKITVAVIDEISGNATADGSESPAADKSGNTSPDERENAAADERSGIAAVNERKIIAAVIDERSVNAASDESETAASDERSEIKAVVERIGIAADGERSGIAADGERSGIAAINERSGIAAINERSGITAINERSGIAAADGSENTAASVSENTVADESKNAAIDERIGIAAVDQTSGIAPVVYETSETPTAGDGRSEVAVVVNARTSTLNFSGGKTELYKSRIKICKEMNEKVTRVSKSINEYCHVTKSFPSQLNQDGNFEHKISSETTCDLDKFIEAINLANSDIVKKSGKLLRKLTLVYEMLSYFQATQSVCRLSVPISISADDVLRDEIRNFDFNSNKNFLSAGECILEELQMYLRHLKADFKDWEAKRLTILRISESIPSQFELCCSGYSTRILMHDISTRICTILQEMNDITSRREEKDIELTEIGDGIDRYIRFSSYFIKGKHPSTGLF